jgi:ribose/xylose/arabinose/galactoside ABC-type transport system permease subunit
VIALAEPTERRRLSLGWVGDYGVYVALALLILINVIKTPHFLSVGSIRTIAFSASPPLLVALGMALSIGTRGIDLSVGAVMGLSAALVQLEINHGAALAMIAAVVVCMAAGMVTGLLITVIGIDPLIATLGMQVGLRGLAEVLTGGQYAPIVDKPFHELGAGLLGGIPIAVIIAVGFALAMAFLVSRTTFGRDVVAIGGNRTASFLSGLRIRRALLIVYVLSALLSAIAALLATGRIAESDPSNLGLLFELNAIAAVVIGGTPLTGGRISIGGTVAGVAFLQLLQYTFTANNLSYDLAQMLSAAVIVVAVYVQRRRGA